MLLDIGDATPIDLHAITHIHMKVCQIYSYQYTCVW